MRRHLLSLALVAVTAALTSIPGPGDDAIASNLGVDSTARRKVSGPVDSASALARLSAEIRSVLGTASEGGAANIGILVRSLRTRATIFSLNPDKPLTPASTTKLVTTFTALSELGPGYRIRTILAAEARPRDGVVRGSLYVKGHGDPFLSVNDVDELVDQLLKLGVRHVAGGVVGDGTFFDNITSRYEYSGDADDPEPVAPIEALTVQGGYFTVIVASTSIAGSPLNVQTYPHSDAFDIVSSATVSSAPSRAGKRGGRTSSDHNVRDRGPTVRNIAGVKVVVTDGPDGRQTITVTGTMPPSRTQSYRHRMKNPPTVIAGMVSERLRRFGVKVDALPTSGGTPPRSKILAETGRPLLDIVRLVMKNSNNFLAEHVFKMIGGAAQGNQPTASRSVAKIHYRMDVNNIDFARCVINDGSGLSRRNCLSAAALTGILEAAHDDPRLFEAIYETMAIAGVDGTLRRRMKGTAAEGNAHAKTGTLRNVSALTGFVTTRDGEMLCFTILMNGSNVGAYRAAQDRIVERLAAFSYAAPPPPVVQPITPAPRKRR